MKQAWSCGVLFLLLAVPVRGQLDEEKQGCAWDVDTNPDQGLDPKSLEAGARHLAHLPEISDSKGCQDACCGNRDCQLALIGTPADGTPECFLVSCMKDGKDVCVLQFDTQFKVYRKKTQPETTKVEVEAVVPIVVNSTAASSEDPASSKDLLPKMTSDDFIELCQASPETGPCRASLRHYYYDSSTGACQPFTYGGCLGNKNNYDTAERCLATCTVTVIPGSKGRKGSGANKPTDEKRIEYKDACMVASDSGPCRAAFTMFYFDHSTSSCQYFIYGGCKGNNNRYLTLDDCMARCTGEDGEHGQHNGRNRMTPAFFLVATLAVISALILVGLILITIRRSRLQHDHHLLSDKDLLPYEQLSEEQLSEDELPKVSTVP